ncbi:hypothetical protein EZV73_14520 [Acidaminobacter sp. JC074]|uniref:hypothetical protein n=1 Tax=Acidaminobacter sp. JC074 TaxID=2530199 RepID=UPI001F0DB82B|nr:hypothetical protein [Acidaminobacter sp. JC074]MCH4888806.1 hypothetical protein [Acidaminobacter sp. JC074]
MRKYLNKKGYTLTYTIVVIGLLLILTGSVTFISYYNLKTARVGGRVNDSFYLNDSSLEEALTDLNRYVYDAEVKAWNHLNEHTFVVNDTTWVNFLSRIYQDVNDPTSGLELEHANDIIARALKGEFEVTFYNELYQGTYAEHDFYNPSGLTPVDRYSDYDSYQGVSLIADTELRTDIQTDLKETDFFSASVEPTVKIESFRHIDVDDDGNIVDGTNGFELVLSTDGTAHNYNKKLQTKLHVVAPKYEFSVAMLTENFIMYKNKLTSYALVANDNIVVLDGDVDVTGDIYALGNYKKADSSYGHVDVDYNLPRDNYGGVVIGYKDSTSERVYGNSRVDSFYTDEVSGNLTVTGSISTRNSVKVESSSVADATKLIVTDDINANAFYVRPGTDAADIKVNDNMMLYADMYVSGTNTKVEVGLSNTETPSGNRNLFKYNSGVIWGLHDTNFSANNAYTRTGSLIIGSSAVNPIIEANGLNLNGVIRYDVEGYEVREPGSGDEKTAYRTGESFTTYKNAQYYQTLMSDNIYQNGVFAFLSSFANSSGVNFDMISFDALAGVNQVAYRSNHYFTMGYMANNPGKFGLDENYYKKVADEDKKILRIRNPKHDGTDSNPGQFYGIQTNGIVAFSKEDGSDGKVYNVNRTEVSDDNKGLVIDVLYDDPSSANDEGVDKDISLLGYTFEYESGGKKLYREETLFSEWIKSLDGDSNVIPSVIPDRDSTSFALYNGESSKDVYINFPSSYYNGDGSPIDSVKDHIHIKGVHPVTENLEGTIVSKGNIYVYAASGETLNFKGNMISEKSIYLFGPGEKNFKVDEQITYGMIHKNQDLVDVYMTEYGRDISIPQGVGTGTSIEPNFSVNIENNTDDSNKISINFVSNANPNGTSIIDSNTIIIDSWQEID